MNNVLISVHVVDENAVVSPNFQQTITAAITTLDNNGNRRMVTMAFEHFQLFYCNEVSLQIITMMMLMSFFDCLCVCIREKRCVNLRVFRVVKFGKCEKWVYSVGNDGSLWIRLLKNNNDYVYVLFRCGCVLLCVNRRQPNVCYWAKLISSI